MNSFSHCIPLLTNIGTIPNQKALNNSTSIPLEQKFLIPSFKHDVLSWSTIVLGIITKSEMEIGSGHNYHDEGISEKNGRREKINKKDKNTPNGSFSNRK